MTKSIFIPKIKIPKILQNGTGNNTNQDETSDDENSTVSSTDLYNDSESEISFEDDQDENNDEENEENEEKSEGDIEEIDLDEKIDDDEEDDEDDDYENKTLTEDDLQNIKKKEKQTIDDCLTEEEFATDFPSETEETLEIEKENRISVPKLTKYERVRLLGARTKQLALGAPALVKNIENKSPQEIAEIELELNMIPLKIKRLLPNNRYEIWSLNELSK